MIHYPVFGFIVKPLYLLANIYVFLCVCGGHIWCSKYMRSCRGDRTKTGATSVLPLLGLTSKTRQFDRTQFCLDDGREIEMHLITMLLVPILTS